MSDFFSFGLVIAASALLVAFGSVGLRTLDGRKRVAIVISCLIAHVAVATTRLGGPVAGSALVLASSVGIGTLLARTIASPGALITLSITASVVDIFSFSGGPTRWLLDSESATVSEVLRYLAVSAPFHGRVVAVVGIGDLLIFSALFLGLRAQGHRAWLAFTLLLLGLLAALAVGLWRGGAFGIPFMAVGAIALSLAKPAREPEGGSLPGSDEPPT